MPSSDRPFRLPEPGEQRPLLPVYLRGALDVGATAINEEMKLAAVARLQNWPMRNRVKWWLQRMGSGSELWSGIHHSKTV